MRLRYSDVPLSRPHYESVYTTLNHPVDPRALWIRTTVQKRPGKPPVGALWVAWFDHDAVTAGKLNDLAVTSDTTGITCGPATQGPVGSRGAIAEGITASWDLAFHPRSHPLAHLTPALLYRSPLPRTKATSPVPDLDVSGHLTVDGEQIDLTGWTGMLGHNWGTEHAARWAWLRVAGLGGDDSGWIDAVLGRVRIGPALAPWVGFGTLELDGQRHRLGGLLNRGTALDIGEDTVTVTLAGSDITVNTTARISLPATVGWVYSDPAGHCHEVVNSSTATTQVELRRGPERLLLRPARRGVIELGADQAAFPIDIQRYPD